MLRAMTLNAFVHHRDNQGLQIFQRITVMESAEHGVVLPWPPSRSDENQLKIQGRARSPFLRVDFKLIVLNGMTEQISHETKITSRKTTANQTSLP